jgi:ABC-type tungstate transport system permease subunit
MSNFEMTLGDVTSIKDARLLAVRRPVLESASLYHFRRVASSGTCQGLSCGTSIGMHGHMIHSIAGEEADRGKSSDQSPVERTSST